MHVACPAPWGRAFGASPLQRDHRCREFVEEATRSLLFRSLRLPSMPRSRSARTRARRSHFRDFSSRCIVGAFVLAHQWPKLMVPTLGLRRPSSPWTCVEVEVRGNHHRIRGPFEASGVTSALGVPFDRVRGARRAHLYVASRRRRCYGLAPSCVFQIGLRFPG